MDLLLSCHRAPFNHHSTGLKAKWMINPRTDHVMDMRGRGCKAMSGNCCYFYILRPNADRVDPEYLAWFINQPTTQACLERLQRGSHIKIIPKSAFEELEVVLPP